MGLPIGAVLEFTVQGRCHNQTILNVFHYEVATPSSTPEVSVEMARFLSTMTPITAGTFMGAFRGALPESYFGVTAVAQALIPTRYRRATAPMSWQGTRGPCQAANLAAVLTIQTRLAGRGEVGSKHLVTGGDGDVQGGILDPTFVSTQLLPLCEQIATPVFVPDGAGLYQPIILHGPNANPRTSRINAVFPQTTARVMRRRTVGLGI